MKSWSCYNQVLTKVVNWYPHAAFGSWCFQRWSFVPRPVGSKCFELFFYYLFASSHIQSRQYRLRLVASDNLNENHTTVLIRVKDVNDNAPIFDRPTYEAQITEENDRNLPQKILTVSPLLMLTWFLPPFLFGHSRYSTTSPWPPLIRTTRTKRLFTSRLKTSTTCPLNLSKPLMTRPFPRKIIEDYRKRSFRYFLFGFICVLPSSRHLFDIRSVTTNKMWTY